MQLNEQQKMALLMTAKQSILTGLQEGEPLSVELAETQESLFVRSGAAFVTLNKQRQLRGCIGSLQAYRPLVVDVAEHAFDAAFKDPRFLPLIENEVAELEIEISVLSPPVLIEGGHSYTSLLSQLQSGVDGLIISDGIHQATFLPAVWEQLPDKEQFVHYLMQKAGMQSWSSSMKCQRYQTISFEKAWHQIES